MIKDTFFSFSRFGKLLYKEISENWKLYVLRALMMYGVLAIVLIWAGYSEYKSYNPLFSFDDLNVRVTTLVTWMWAWWGFICLGTSFAFESMKSKTRRITNLMVPATTFEKYFLRWMIYVLILPLLIYFSMVLADYTRVFVCSMIYSEIPSIETTQFKYFVDQGDGGYSLCHNWSQGILLILLNLYIQSLFLLGSIFWSKNAFIKTLISLVVIGFVYYWSGVVAVHVFKDCDIINLNSFIFKWGHILFPILTIINWVLTYFRLKESEVIHRM